MVAGKVKIRVDRAVGLKEASLVGSMHVSVTVSCGRYSETTEEGKGENPVFPDVGNSFSWSCDDEWEINFSVTARRHVRSDKQLGQINLSVAEASKRCQSGPVLLPLTNSAGGHAHGELRISVEFKPSDGAQAAAAAASDASQLCAYRVDVKTSDILGAGTDCPVKVVIVGTNGDSGELELKSGRDDFERNKFDSFIVKAPDVGPELRSCQVMCGGSGVRVGGAWHLAYISVTNMATGVQAKFPYNNWFDAKSGWSHLLTAEAAVVEARPASPPSVAAPSGGALASGHRHGQKADPSLEPFEGRPADGGSQRHAPIISNYGWAAVNQNL